MPITAWVISVLAILAVPILLIRFRKRWVAALNLVVTNRITSRFAARLPGFGIACRSEVGQRIANANECFLSAGEIPDCADLRRRKLRNGGRKAAKNEVADSSLLRHPS
jgi:hypothetical protein